LMSKEELQDPEAVLNGIAYDQANNKLFVTGKLWPSLFEIKVKR
jgi:glutaminyl-peptide cyclotransferase